MRANGRFGRPVGGDKILYRYHARQRHHQARSLTTSDETIMSASQSMPSTLVELLERAPAEKIAVVLPEQHVHITYAELRTQVKAVAEQLAAAGVKRGDRVGIALANGLPLIVSFLAAAAAGTAAPLNPSYRGGGPGASARRR